MKINTNENFTVFTEKLVTVKVNFMKTSENAAFSEPKS